MKRHLEATRIIKRAFVGTHSSQVIFLRIRPRQPLTIQLDTQKTFPSTPSIIQSYLGLTPQYANDLMSLVDETQNGLLLELHYNYMFERFAWTLKPTVRSNLLLLEIMRHFNPLTQPYTAL
jgi:hypothetical protein